MKKIKIAVLGASGIGKFHFREFVNAGAEVVAILGSKEETATKTAQILMKQYGVDARPYSKLSEMLTQESLDAVSICTPPNMHYNQTKECLNANLHVLCEKPFVLNHHLNNYGLAEETIKLAGERGRVLTVNTQWPSILDSVKKELEISETRKFSMYMEPGHTGINMLIDHLPHTNSMLVKLIRDGKAEDIRIVEETPRQEHISISFKYSNLKSSCQVNYEFKFKADRPRKVSFCFNNQKFTREIDEGYHQRLESNTKRIDIEDPFRVSIRKFLGAIKGECNPLISTNEILENVKLQEDILAKCISRRI